MTSISYLVGWNRALLHFQSGLHCKVSSTISALHFRISPLLTSFHQGFIHFTIYFIICVPFTKCFGQESSQTVAVKYRNIPGDFQSKKSFLGVDQLCVNKWKLTKSIFCYIRHLFCLQRRVSGATNSFYQTYILSFLKSLAHSFNHVYVSGIISTFIQSPLYFWN